MLAIAHFWLVAHSTRGAEDTHRKWFPVKAKPPRSNTMTRGYLSLRFNEANLSHHLYVNTGGRTDGNYWVAYTLHFGGLGLRAIEAWKGAAKCFEALRMPDDHERCRLKSISIPVYYGRE